MSDKYNIVSNRFRPFVGSIRKDLKRSYAVYVRSLRPRESQTIESAFIRVIP